MSDIDDRKKKELELENWKCDPWSLTFGVIGHLEMFSIVWAIYDFLNVTFDRK